MPFEDYSVFPFPVLDENVELTEPIGTGHCYILSKGALENPAAKLYAEFLFTDEAQDIYGELYGSFPVIKGNTPAKAMSEYLFSLIGDRTKEIQWQTPAAWMAGEIIDIWDKRLYGIIDQEESIEQLDAVYEEFRQEQ